MFRFQSLIIVCCSKYRILINKQSNLLFLSTQRSFTSHLKNKIEISTEGCETVPLPHYLKPFASTSVENILSGIESGFHYADSVTLLKSLRVQMHLKKIDINQLNQDERFETLCVVFSQNSYKLNASSLVSGLRSLLEIGVDPETACIKNVEYNILSSIWKFDMTSLVSCLHLHSKYDISSDLKKKVINKLTNAIYTRISELSTEPETLMLIQVLHLFEKDCIKILEDKLVELIGLLNASDLCKVICILAEKSSRNKPILNSVSFHLSKKDEKPNLKQTVDVLYSLNTLNFPNPSLISYLTENRTSEILEVKQPSLISGLLTALGFLRWRQSDILDACGKWIVENIDTCKPRELVSYILTAAALNYNSKSCFSLP